MAAPTAIPTETLSADALRTLRGRQLAALRACLFYPQGLRHEAYPSAMPVLLKLGLVVSQPAQGQGREISAWFITEAGRAHPAEIDGALTGRRRL